MRIHLLSAVALLAHLAVPLAAHAGDVAELEILGFSKDGALSAYAVLIAVRQYGFEGPNFRWIAVTGRL